MKRTIQPKELTKELKEFFSNISKEEARRGIYIDFEGFQDKSPTLIGILVDGNFKQVVFDEMLKPAADEKGLTVIDANEYLPKLIQLAKNESRRIIAFSQYENNVFSHFFSLDLNPYYCDVRFIAKRLKSKKYPSYPLKSRELKKYLEMIGFDRPPHLGERKSTKRIRDVMNGIEKKVDYQKLKPVQKAKWTKLLDHNETDVKGIEAIVQDFLKTSSN